MRLYGDTAGKVAPSGIRVPAVAAVGPLWMGDRPV